MADITEVSRALSAKAVDVAAHLLPNGKKDGAEWRAGSIHGEPGKSLGVHLTGQKAGVWQDFATNEGGDLLALWAAVRGMPLGEALREARSWLGMSEPPAPVNRPQRNYKRPPKPKCSVVNGRSRDYLTEERNIPGHVLDAYKVASEANSIVFPFLLPDGALALAKFREAKDGGRTQPTARDCEPILFGWQAVPDNAREVTITEGEIDALSMAAYGYPAMSVPFGGGKGAKQRWIENDFERMDRFERIYLATDMDGPGDEAADEIAGRLGRHRCFRIELPRKDANECLTDGVTPEEMAGVMAAAKSLDPPGLRRPSEFAADVVALFWPKEGDHIGYRTPYKKLGTSLLFRPSEITVWTGLAGAGKSQVLSDIVVDAIDQGSRVCVASFEMKGALTLKRMLKQVLGVDRPTDRAANAGLAWLDRGLLLYDRIGKVSPDRVLEIFTYARAKYGCDQFIIDSLMRLGIAKDDYSGQEKAVFAITNWASENGVHVHLVAHSRKPGQNRGVGDMQDVRGAGEIVDNAHNVVIVHRRRKHEEDIAAAEKDKDEEKLAELRQEPGVILKVDKQRNGDFDGKIGLWFDRTTYRYHSSHDDQQWGRRYAIGDLQPVDDALEM